MSDLLTRRRFLSALAASVVAAGMPLPIGFPRKTVSFDTTDADWEADGTRISLKYWNIFEQLKATAADLDIDTIVLQLNTNKVTI